jgi:hypothetical protein
LAQLGPTDGEAQMPTSQTMSPSRVDCKMLYNKAANCAAKNELTFSFLALLAFDADADD